MEKVPDELPVAVVYSVPSFLTFAERAQLVRGWWDVRVWLCGAFVYCSASSLHVFGVYSCCLPMRNATGVFLTYATLPGLDTVTNSNT